MKASLRIAILLVSVVSCLSGTGCEVQQELRGSIETSDDGKTYLSIDDNNGGACGPLLVDGKPWKSAIGETAEVTAGDHTISCGSSITITIEKGTTFHMNYWGP